MGPHLQHLKKLQESGVPVELLDKQPFPEPEGYECFKGFEALSSSRDRLDALQPIKISEIYYYCKIIEEPDTEYFMTVVKQLDRFYMNWADSKRKG